MGSGYTTVRDRPYPLSTDTPNVPSDMQALAQSVATAPNATSGLQSALPTTAAPTAVGDLYFATDTKILWFFNGTAWQFCKGPGPSIGYLNNTSSYVAINTQYELLCAGTFEDPGGYFTGAAYSMAFKCPVAGYYKSTVELTISDGTNIPACCAMLYVNHTGPTYNIQGSQHQGPNNSGYTAQFAAASLITVTSQSAGDLLSAGGRNLMTAGTLAQFDAITLTVEQVG